MGTVTNTEANGQAADPREHQAARRRVLKGAAAGVGAAAAAMAPVAAQAQARSRTFVLIHGGKHWLKARNHPCLDPHGHRQHPQALQGRLNDTSLGRGASRTAGAAGGSSVAGPSSQAARASCSRESKVAPGKR